MCAIKRHCVLCVGVWCTTESRTLFTIDAGCWTIDSLSMSFLAGLRLRRCSPRMWRDVIQKDFIHIDVGKADE